MSLSAILPMDICVDWPPTNKVRGSNFFAGTDRVADFDLVVGMMGTHSSRSVAESLLT